MAGELTRLDRSAAEPSGFIGTIQRRFSRAGAEWRALRPLIRRAIERIRAADGFVGKLKETYGLALKARARTLRRAAIISAREDTNPHAHLADYVDPPKEIPECRSLGGGMLVISLAGSAGQIREVALRDQSGVFHRNARIQRVGRPDESRPPKSTDLHSLAVDFARDAIQVIVSAPAELFETMTGEIDVHVHADSESIVFSDIALGNAPVATITRFVVENNLVLFAGNVKGDVPENLQIGLFVDGTLSASTKIRTRSFSGAMPLDSAHLDGATHQLELRELPSMAVLTSTFDFLPLHVTPWDALQTYARAPLDGTLSPAARHHFRSFRLWLENVAERGGVLPPIGRLYAEILHGPKKRPEYPPLEFPHHQNPIVTIVLPVHNKIEVTYLCLCSLIFAYNDTPFEIVLVDDGSGDETRYIEQFVRGIRVLRHDSARGFVDSCNAGASHARGEFITFLNNDTEVTARWLDELVETFRSFDGIGLAGSKLVYPDGRLQEAGGIIWRGGDPWNVGRGGNANDPRYTYLRQVDYVSGAAMMVRRDVWTKVNGFSPEFAPGYFEDTDLAMKVREAGYLVVYVPGSTVVHYEGMSAGTDTTSGMKRFQEINRPKFKEKWGRLFHDYRSEGDAPDLEKDRTARFRALFLDHQFPNVDADAGSYAAFQEIRLLQSVGAKVTFLPRNLAWMDRHTVALERIGVECLYAPHVTNYAGYIRDHAAEYDVIFVCRHQIAEQIVPLVRAASPSTKIVFNLADLHFLRELREIAARTEGFADKRPEATRAAELSVVQSCDLTFSYTEVEIAVLESHLKRPANLARLPWVTESRPSTRKFADTRDILFLGGFSHPPNAQAVRFFANDVMPGVRERLPNVRFDVVGKGSEEALQGLSTEYARVLGHVPDLDDAMASARIFVAPLLAGAGLKGKVVEAISRGVPCVLSPIAAEGTGLVDGISCLIADTVARWTECVSALYTDESLWTSIASNALKLAETKYAFHIGANEFARALEKIGIAGRGTGNLVYRHVRPRRYGI